MNNETFMNVIRDFKARCETIINEQIDEKVKEIKEENKKLTEQNILLKQKYSESLQQIENLNLEEILSKRVKDVVKKDPERIFILLNYLYQKDFNENTYNAPIWIGCLTQYYSHKTEVLNILKRIIPLPENIDDFRLPLDWTEKELDIFFNTMNNHVNTNACVYNNNLGFWAQHALKSVHDQCKKISHDNIPWQFLLRNPLLKKEKYLKQIGKHLTDRNSNWYKFALIKHYLSLEDSETKIILDNIDAVLFGPKSNAWDFVLNNLSLVENEVILDKVYVEGKASYYFSSNKLILDMPYKYFKQYCKDCKEEALKILKDINNKKFNTEQYKECINIIFTLE